MGEKNENLLLGTAVCLHGSLRGGLGLLLTETETLLHITEESMHLTTLARTLVGLLGTGLLSTRNGELVRTSGGRLLMHALSGSGDTLGMGCAALGGNLAGRLT